MSNSKLPISDLHCDLLLYLAIIDGASIEATEDIGVTLPYLRQGNVQHQAAAIFARTDEHSVDWGEKQVAAYQELLELPDFYALDSAAQLTEETPGVGLTLAIENASILALEDEPFNKVIKRLDHILGIAGRLFYITMTHHTENRFGGGNYSEVGLKPDGERLLDYMAERQITIDLSHTSDQLADGILSYLEKQNLQIPVIASHSNFRVLTDHPRNLTTEIVQEIVRRDGLIGANFLRLFLDGARSESLLEHIEYGIEHAPNNMAFGADFFYRPAISAPERQPLFFTEYEDAGQYPKILQQLADRGIGQEALEQLAYGNVERFIRENW